MSDCRLEAVSFTAAPILADAVAEAILAHMRQHFTPRPGIAIAARRHFRIAAQVASRGVLHP
jgi:hypothetical protein